MIDYRAYRKRVDELGGDQLVHVKLGAIYETLEAIERGDLGHAIIVLRRMAASDDRKKLRKLRDEVYRRLRHAIDTGDTKAVAEYTEQLQKIEEAKHAFIA